MKRLLDNIESLKASESVLHMERKKAKRKRTKVNREHFNAFREKIEATKESSNSSYSNSDC